MSTSGEGRIRKYELLRFEMPEDLARAAAADWVAQLPKPGAAAETYTVAVPGGRIVVHFYRALAELVRSSGVSLKGVHFFWGDERCVPPTDTESNFRLAKESLFDPLVVPQEQIHRIRGEVDPQVAAKEATAELRRWAPAGPGNQPLIDLVILGLGENGHTASLFPEESPAEVANPAVYRPVVATKPPPRRITLGYPALAAARQVWVLASGSGKEKALRGSLAAGDRTPLGRVLGLRTGSKVYTDIPAQISGQ